MGTATSKCSHCGTVVTGGAAFCPHCGKPTAASPGGCPRCGKPVVAGAKFCAACGAAVGCPACGSPLPPQAQFCGNCGAPARAGQGAAPPVTDLNRWQALGIVRGQYRWNRNPQEYARRVEARDLRGILQRGLVVEPDTVALVFQGGALADVFSGGTYDLNQFPGAVDLGKPATAILADAGEVPLMLRYPDLWTSDDVKVHVEIRAVVVLADPLAFFTNVMHGRETVTLADLAGLIHPDVAGAVQSQVRQVPVAEVDAIKPELLQGSIAPELARYGLELAAVRLAGSSTDEYEEIRRRRGQTSLGEQKVADAERRAVLRERLRDTLTRDQMSKFSSTRDFEDFVRQAEHELGMKDVLRSEEMMELGRIYAEKRGDAELARRHLLERLEMEQAADLACRRREEEDRDLEHRIRQGREVLQARREADFDQAQLAKKIGDLDRQSAIESQEARIDALRKKADLAIHLRQRRAEVDDEQEARRLAREQEARDREARRDLDKIHALSEAEQARLAADLRKTEVLKNLTEDQILALMAKDSPHVAAAIAERAKAQAAAGSGAEVRAIYDKFLADKEAAADRLERFAERALASVERATGASVAREREYGRDIQEMTGRSMDRMAEVAGTKAAAPAVRTAGYCRKCRQPAPPASRFCEHCGEPLQQPPES